MYYNLPVNRTAIASPQLAVQTRKPDKVPEYGVIIVEIAKAVLKMHSMPNRCLWYLSSNMPAKNLK